MKKTLKALLCSSTLMSTLTFGIVGGVVSMAPTEVEAGCCSSNWKATRDLIELRYTATEKNIDEEHNATRDQVKTSIEKQTKDQIKALKEQMALLIDNLKGQSLENTNYQKMQIEAAQRIEDAAQINHTNRLKDQIRAEAESGKYDPNPFACMLLGLFDSTDRAEAERLNGSDIAEEVNDYLTGNTPSVKKGGLKLTEEIAANKQKFANTDGKVNASADWSLLSEKGTLRFDEADFAELSGIIIRNSMDSTPMRAPTADEYESSEGLDRIADYEEYTGRMSAALQSITMTNNMYDPVLVSQDALEKYRTMAANSAYNREIGDVLSEMQQLDIRIVQEYAPTETVRLERGDMEVAQWLEQIHGVLALNARVDYIALELAARDARVNALILAALTDKD